MKNIEDINRESVKKILAKKKIPDFFAGDTIKVGVRITEGKREKGAGASKEPRHREGGCQKGFRGDKIRAIIFRSGICF